MRLVSIALLACLICGCDNTEPVTGGQCPQKVAPAQQQTTPVQRVEPAQTTPPVQQPAVAPAAKPNEFVATKNARVFFHSSETNFNGGGSHRLRAADVNADNGDVSIVDFDRAAIKAFLDKSKGKNVSAALVLSIRALDKDQAGKLEVACVDSGSDWNQGDKAQQQAGKGEVTNSAAQFGEKKWTTVDGKNVSSLHDLVFGDGGKVKTMLNGNAVNVTAADKGKKIEIPLDAGFLAHLANDPNCRGVMIFTRTDNARVYFSSRDKEGHEPTIVVTVK